MVTGDGIKWRKKNQTSSTMGGTMRYLPVTTVARTIIFKSRALKYAAIALLPLVALTFTPMVKFAVLTFGERALLETRPVDPRELLRGDYVTLDYKISDIPRELLSKDEFSPSNEYVYVTLSLDGAGVASVADASLSRPSKGLYIRGRFHNSMVWSDYSIDYGLGVYYVPEGTGKELERLIRENGKVFADVRILRGHGVIKKLEIRE
jgi:uncharacterized membrane-anchored protein